MRSIKIFFSLVIGLFLITSSFFLTSCSDTKSFYFANFESYMNPKLISKIKSENLSVNFRYFATNEDLERSFVRDYDLAIPSAYLMAKQAKDGLLEKIDWKIFNIQYEINGVITLIKTPREALSLFTPVVQTALTKVYDIDDNGIFDDNDNLLQYGVPYFLQDFILGYKGPNVPQLEGDITWSDTMNYLSGKVGAGLNYNKIAMINDYRSIYSIPRIIETQSSGSVNVNPPSNSKTTINDFQITYNYLSGLFPLNSFLLNSDSGEILNNFANPKGSQVGIMYNGDLLYAIQGGDEQFQISPNDVHLVRPRNTLITLDMMIINAKSNKKQKAYELIKQVALEGISANEDITLYDNVNDEYQWGPMQNFDHIQYTSPLEKISNYVLSNNINNSYFKDSNLDPIIIDLCKKIFNVIQIPSDRNMFEYGLNDLEKSNMYQAFLREKGKF